jgi:RNA polymerase sigma-70 factor, ECF subfamily
MFFGKILIGDIGYIWECCSIRGRLKMCQDRMSGPQNPVASPNLGEMSALANLLEEHRPALLKVLRWRMPKLLAATIDAEDIWGNVFFEARRKWPAFQSEQKMSPRAWLYRLALDCLSQEWKRVTREMRDVRKELPYPEHSTAQLGLGLIASITSPSSAAFRNEHIERMHQALDSLRPNDREILVMRHYDDLSFKEAAEILSITQNAATVRYWRALQQLKHRLAELD